MGNFADLGNFQFVTVDEKGLIGSVYFERGRIRLVHKYGPCISDFASMLEKERKRNPDIVDIRVSRSFPDVRGFNADRKTAMAFASQKMSLFEIMEFLDNTGKVLLTKHHKSRGCPCQEIAFSKTVVSKCGDIFNKLDTLEFRNRQALFSEARKSLEKLNVTPDERDGMLPSLSFYNEMTDISCYIYGIDKKAVHLPKDYGFSVLKK